MFRLDGGKDWSYSLALLRRAVQGKGRAQPTAVVLSLTVRGLDSLSERL